MIFDLHNDFPTALPSSEYKKYLASLTPNEKVTAVIWTSAYGYDAEKTVLDITDKLPKIDNAIPLAIEDIGFTAENNRFEEFDFSRYIYCSLTWNDNNAFAGGALSDGVLTGVGKKAIRSLNESGCALDLAHLNRKSFYSALDNAEYVLCSHTGFNDHPRALNDDQIAALVGRKALIGLCTVTAFSSARSSTEFSDVIDRFIQRYGDDSLAIGTDYYGSTDIPSDISDYESLYAVGELLYKRGYNKKTVYKIFYGNADKFFHRRLK